MENNNIQQGGFAQQNPENEGMEISLRSIWKFFAGNWFWFMVSVVCCVAAGFLY